MRSASYYVQSILCIVRRDLKTSNLEKIIIFHKLSVKERRKVSHQVVLYHACENKFCIKCCCRGTGHCYMAHFVPSSTVVIDLDLMIMHWVRALVIRTVLVTKKWRQCFAAGRKYNVQTRISTIYYKIYFTNSSFL